MDNVLGLTMDVIGYFKRYSKNQLLLVRHLMEAGLLPTSKTECHGPMALHSSNPWKWRCSKRDCSKHVAVVFKCAYLWCQELSSKVIQKEARLSDQTVAILTPGVEELWLLYRNQV